MGMHGAAWKERSNPPIEPQAAMLRRMRCLERIRVYLQRAERDSVWFAVLRDSGIDTAVLCVKSRAASRGQSFAGTMA